MKTIDKKKDGFLKFICIIIFLTNVGQTPTLIDNFQTRNIIIPIWLLFAVVCVLKNHYLYIGETKYLWILAALWSIVYFIGGFFIPGYSSSNLPYTIFLSLFILLVGLMAGGCIYCYGIEKIATAFIVSGMIVCLDTFITYVYGRSLGGRIYSYDSKNSVSQILLTVWILIIFVKFRKEYSYFKRTLYVVAFIILTVTLVGLKSRATLIAIPVVLIWIVFHGKLDRRLKNMIMIALFFIILIFMFNPNLVETLLYDVMLGGRNINDLNDISSGRTSEWQMFLSDFSDKPFFGHGRMKRESIILTSLLEFGFLGGGIILLIAIWPLYWGIHYLRKSNRYYLLFTSIAIIYTLNGIFEQLAPFGPGVKCYFLWFLMGILISASSSTIHYKKEINGDIE